MNHSTSFWGRHPYYCHAQLLQNASNHYQETPFPSTRRLYSSYLPPPPASGIQSSCMNRGLGRLCHTRTGRNLLTSYNRAYRQDNTEKVEWNSLDDGVKRVEVSVITSRTGIYPPFSACSLHKCRIMVALLTSILDSESERRGRLGPSPQRASDRESHSADRSLEAI